MPGFPARELAVHCARVVDQKGGEAVVVLQLPASAHSFDYAVLVSASSDRLTNALVEEVWHFCKRHGVQRMPVEGESGWMLIDCFDVVVHALSADKRAFYQLDTLWPLAKKVLWEKEAKALPDPDKTARTGAGVEVDEVESPEAEAEAETEDDAEEPAPAPKKRAVRTKKAAAEKPAAATKTAGKAVKKTVKAAAKPAVKSVVKLKSKPKSTLKAEPKVEPAVKSAARRKPARRAKPQDAGDL